VKSEKAGTIPHRTNEQTTNQKGANNMAKKHKQNTQTHDTASGTVEMLERTLPNGKKVQFPNINDMMREAGIVEGINKTNALEARQVFVDWHDQISEEHRTWLASSAKNTTDDDAGKKLRSDKLFRGAYKVGRSGLAPCCGYIDKETGARVYAEGDTKETTHNPLISISNMGALYEMFRCDACNAKYKELYGNGTSKKGPKKSELEKVQDEIADAEEVIGAMQAVSIDTSSMETRLQKLRDKEAKLLRNADADVSEDVDDDEDMEQYDEAAEN